MSSRHPSSDHWDDVDNHPAKERSRSRHSTRSAPSDSGYVSSGNKHSLPKVTPRLSSQNSKSDRLASRMSVANSASQAGRSLGVKRVTVIPVARPQKTEIRGAVEGKVREKRRFGESEDEEEDQSTSSNNTRRSKKVKKLCKRPTITTEDLGGTGGRNGNIGKEFRTLGTAWSLSGERVPGEQYVPQLHLLKRLSPSGKKRTVVRDPMLLEQQTQDVRIAWLESGVKVTENGYDEDTTLTTAPTPPWLARHIHGSSTHMNNDEQRRQNSRSSTESAQHPDSPPTVAEFEQLRVSSDPLHAFYHPLPSSSSLLPLSGIVHFHSPPRPYSARGRASPQMSVYEPPPVSIYQNQFSQLENSPQLQQIFQSQNTPLSLVHSNVYEAPQFSSLEETYPRGVPYLDEAGSSDPSYVHTGARDYAHSFHSGTESYDPYLARTADYVEDEGWNQDATAESLLYPPSLNPNYQFNNSSPRSSPELQKRDQHLKFWAPAPSLPQQAKPALQDLYRIKLLRHPPTSRHSRDSFVLPRSSQVWHQTSDAFLSPGPDSHQRSHESLSPLLSQPPAMNDDTGENANENCQPLQRPSTPSWLVDLQHAASESFTPPPAKPTRTHQFIRDLSPLCEEPASPSPDGNVVKKKLPVSLAENEAFRHENGLDGFGPSKSGSGLFEVEESEIDVEMNFEDDEDDEDVEGQVSRFEIYEDPIQDC